MNLTVLTALSGVCWALSWPAFADNEPEDQKEADWVDARWSQTDLGNFHSSIVRLPEGSVAKGLSVRLGDRGQAAVVYDTASATLRGGWTGGFLKFSGARYGLIEAPRPGGTIRFLGRPTPAWGQVPVRWRGCHVNGPRLVLEYEVGGVAIRESPWYENEGGVEAFTRSLELAGPGEEQKLLADLTGLRDPQTKTIAGVRVLSLNTEDGIIGAALHPESDAELIHNGRSLAVVFPASRETRRAKIFLATLKADLLEGFAALVKDSAPPEDLAALARPGPSRWQPLVTRGQLGLGADALLIDTLTVPYENPWQALFFISGVDFLPNGDAAVCTIHGDVWRVSGIDEKLERLTWRRFATGLFQPLGLRTRGGEVYVLGRDQITRLHDENGDGEADFYENFCSQIRTSTSGHDYVTSLETDSNGNFYYVDPRGVHRISAGGTEHETLAAGWRNPNGLGVSPDGNIITVAPQQGEWTPSSALCEVKPGGWYGHGGPRATPQRPLGYDPPLCWIPHRVDNSGGSQLWVSSDRWGVPRGHLLHFSFGRCAQLLVLREVLDGVAQGAVAPLPGRFLSGIMRGAFNPRDGQLYVAGCRGWQTSAVRDGCLQRARYTGLTALLVPIEVHAHSNGLRLSFSAPLDRESVTDTGSYAASHWNYRYASGYGSKDYAPSAPGQEGRDPLEVRSARLLPGGSGVFLEMPGLRPVMQWELRYNIKSAQGKAIRSELHGTIHRLGPEWPAVD